MKPHIIYNKGWEVVNFQECWDSLIDSALDANDWCVCQNNKVAEDGIVSLDIDVVQRIFGEE